MNAQAVVQLGDVPDDEMLDGETSAAILRWMETAVVPDGVDADAWERWVDGGCKGRIEAHGGPLTSAMLGRWARTGMLR